MTTNEEDIMALYSMAETYLRDYKINGNKRSLEKGISILIKIKDNLK